MTDQHYDDSWLQRLISSPTFDAKLALFYLHRYPKNTGLQFHLTKKLKEFPIEGIEPMLPQLLHLLLSKPIESAFIEDALLDLCAESNHVALLVFIN